MNSRASDAAESSANQPMTNPKRPPLYAKPSRQTRLATRFFLLMSQATTTPALTTQPPANPFHPSSFHQPASHCSLARCLPSPPRQFIRQKLSTLPLLNHLHVAFICFFLSLLFLPRNGQFFPRHWPGEKSISGFRHPGSKGQLRQSETAHASVHAAPRRAAARKAQLHRRRHTSLSRFTTRLPSYRRSSACLRLEPSGPSRAPLRTHPSVKSHPSFPLAPFPPTPTPMHSPCGSRSSRPACRRTFSA